MSFLTPAGVAADRGTAAAAGAAASILSSSAPAFGALGEPRGGLNRLNRGQTPSPHGAGGGAAGAAAGAAGAGGGPRTGRGQESLDPSAIFDYLFMAYGSPFGGAPPDPSTGKCTQLTH